MVYLTTLYRLYGAKWWASKWIRYRKVCAATRSWSKLRHYDRIGVKELRKTCQHSVLAENRIELCSTVKVDRRFNLQCRRVSQARNQQQAEICSSQTSVDFQPGYMTLYSRWQNYSFRREIYECGSVSTATQWTLGYSHKCFAQDSSHVERFILCLIVIKSANTCQIRPTARGSHIQNAWSCLLCASAA
jgi:hypothetical protein